MLNIQVVYALPAQQIIQALPMKKGDTVKDVLAVCQSLPAFALWDLEKHAVGIYGKRVELTQVIQEGDRIEIYRPLLQDPKTARRLRAQKKKR